jgi:hypothetical protein
MVMAKVIDLDARLGRLSQTVKHRIATRNERLIEDHAKKQSRKTSDWQTVQDNYSDHAQFISDFTAVFGKPASVKVTANSGDVILDSARYGS